MKKLTGALVLSLSFLLFTGCCTSRPARDAGDASTPQTQDSGTEATVGTSPSPEPTPGHGLAGGATSVRPSEAERQAQEACVDQWLKSHKLDRYGNPEGTMYTGGTPLFDERTGESRDRMEYVFDRQPEAQKTCASPKDMGTDEAPATHPQNKK
jgi:hypothetical protein